MALTKAMAEWMEKMGCIQQMSSKVDWLWKAKERGPGGQDDFCHF